MLLVIMRGGGGGCSERERACARERDRASERARVFNRTHVFKDKGNPDRGRDSRARCREMVLQYRIAGVGKETG